MKLNIFGQHLGNPRQNSQIYTFPHCTTVLLEPIIGFRMFIKKNTFFAFQSSSNRLGPPAIPKNEDDPY